MLGNALDDGDSAGVRRRLSLLRSRGHLRPRLRVAARLASIASTATPMGTTTPQPLEAMRLAAEIAREQERTSMQTRTKRAIWIAQEMLRRSRQQRPRD